MTDHPKGQPIHTPFLNWPVEHYPDGTHKIGGSGAPIDASYITTTSEPKLTNEKVLGSEIIMRGPAASRPSPGIPGRLYIENDGDQRTLRDAGSSWTEIARTQWRTNLIELHDRAHDSLTGVSPNQHHDRLHDHSDSLDGSPIAVAGVPNLPASKITSGVFDTARYPAAFLHDGTRAATGDWNINGYLLKNAKGIFGSLGKAIVSADKFDTLNAAVAALPAAGGIILIPAEFAAEVSESVLIDKPVVILGALGTWGCYNIKPCSIILAKGTPASDDSVFDFAQGGSLHCEGVTFKNETAGSNWHVVNGYNSDAASVALSMKRCLALNRFKRLFGVFYNFWSVVLQDIYADCWTAGIEIGITNIPDGMILFDNVHIQFSSPATAAAGFYVSTNQLFYPQVTLRSCSVRNAGSSGAGFTFLPNSLITASSCLAHACQGDGFRVAGSSSYPLNGQVVLEDCRAIQNTKHGFNIAGSAANSRAVVTLDSCFAADNGYAGGDFDGFYLGDYVAAAWIRNCRGYSDGTHQRYGINFASASTVIKQYFGNDFSAAYRSGSRAENWHSSILRGNIELGHNRV
jgi:hypothetical protein